MHISVKNCLQSLKKEPFKSKRQRMLSHLLLIIGLRVDEALSKIEPFLNHALLAGLSKVVIIHE